jgi:hypothetical protein
MKTVLEATWLRVKSCKVSAWAVSDVVPLIVGDFADIAGIQK